MKKEGKIKVVIATLMVAMAFGAFVPTVNAADITTTWIVPGDTTIAVSYPTGEGKIEFDADPIGQNFSDLRASSQGASTAALKITNQGNQNLDIDMSWSAAWPTGVKHVNISAGDNSNSSSFTYTAANAQVDQTVATIADGGNEEFWFWTHGKEVAANAAGIDRTLVATASAA